MTYIGLRFRFGLKGLGIDNLQLQRRRLEMPSSSIGPIYYRIGIQP